MKQLNLTEAKGLRRAVKPMAGVALLVVLAAFGCSSSDSASSQPRSLLPNAYLRSTDKVRTENKVPPVRSLDPLGAAVATSGDSLPARSITIYQPNPPGSSAVALGAVDPAPGPAGGTQVPGITTNLFGVRELTVNPSVANPYGAVGIVSDAGGAIVGGTVISGTTAASTAVGTTGVGTLGATGVAGSGMVSGVATTPGFTAGTVGTLTTTSPGAVGVGTLGVNGVAGPGTAAGIVTTGGLNGNAAAAATGIGVAGPISPVTAGSLNGTGITNSVSTAPIVISGTNSSTSTSSTVTAGTTVGSANGTLVAPRMGTPVTGFTSSSTAGTAATTQSGRSRFRIVNMFRRGTTSTVTVQTNP